MRKFRLSMDMEEKEHLNLRMCCLKLGISMKSFVLDTVMKRVEEQEDKWWTERPETQEILRKSREGTLEMIDFDDYLKESANHV